ncbi:MAG: hypothetical protein QOH30_4169, partial [Baekduia sp.]|nr:hypothetical protein [Baekduia sp.]
CLEGSGFASDAIPPAIRDGSRATRHMARGTLVG